MRWLRVEENPRNIVGIVGHLYDVTVSATLASTTKRALEAHCVGTLQAGIWISKVKVSWI